LRQIILLASTWLVFATIPVSAAVPIITPAVVPVKKTLVYHENITRTEVEAFTEEKMKLLDRLAFKLDKKKYVETINFTQSQNTEEEEIETWAIVGFVCSFLIWPLGIVFSLIALGKIKKKGNKGRGLAIAGLIISVVWGTIILISLF
jgi:Domain of unknown function (DUF4190)